MRLRFGKHERGPRSLPAEDKPIDSERSAARWMTMEGAWYAFLGMLCLVIALTALISTAAISPRFCATCHATASDSLASSKHAAIECDSCHVESGALGLVENRFRVVSMVLRAPVAWVSRPDVAEPPLDNGACLECHGEIESGTVEVGGVRMSHRAPLEAGWLCVDCHHGSAHPGETFKGASYSMEKCLQCHTAGTNNLSSCEMCHEQNGGREDRPPTAWQVTHGANWQRTHGMGDLTTCRACHAPDYCVACHNLSLPHPANFLSVHGEVVVQRPDVARDCNACHQASVCDNCHGMEMPHPAGFTKRHKSLVETEGRDVCDRCHTEESCEACHVRHTHPGLPPKQRDYLLDNPVEVR